MDTLAKGLEGSRPMGNRIEPLQLGVPARNIGAPGDTELQS